jgi:hypothetical protein
MRHTEVGRAAAEAAEALRRHAEAVTAGGDEVDHAAAALARALEDYGDALINHDSAPLEALTEMADELTANDDEEPDEEPLPAGTRLSIRLREDVIVADPQRLIEAGRRAYRDRWPDDSDDEVDANVSDVINALHELVHDPWLLAEYDEEDGLVHAGSVWAVCEVSEAWQERGDQLLLEHLEVDGTSPYDPFALPVDEHEK